MLTILPLSPRLCRQLDLTLLGSRAHFFEFWGRNKPMSISWIDILFLITVVLLVFNGFRNGAVFSLISLIGLPLGLWIAYTYGPNVTSMLASNGIPATPLIAYIV